MNTKDLLFESVEKLKNKENFEASLKIQEAKQADVDNNFLDVANMIYGQILLDDEDIARKFKNLYSQYEEVKVTDKEQIIINNTNTNINSDRNRYMKNKWISLALCLILGYLGAHKFYEGKYILGVLYIFTFGLFGLGVLVDAITLVFKPNPYMP